MSLKFEPSHQFCAGLNAETLIFSVLLFFSSIFCYLDCFILRRITFLCLSLFLLYSFIVLLAMVLFSFVLLFLLSCKDVPRTGRPPLALGRQLGAFLQKCPLANAEALPQHFLMSVLTIKEILSRELGLKVSRGAGWPICCPSPRKVLVLKHQQRCYELYTGRERPIVKESQHVMA
jgi:hypothetical protein